MASEEYYKQRIEELEREGQQQEHFSNPDVIATTNEIREKITEIKAERGKIKNAATEKALSISDYDRHLALTVLKLKNGLIREMADPETGEVIEVPNLPATVIPQIAKGIIWEKSCRKEEAEAMYKAILSNLEAIKAELNGLQSISKHLE